MAGWSELWTRAPRAGRALVDEDVHRGGSRSVRIEHRGTQDWSFGSRRRVAVEPGDLFVLEAWVKLEGRGSATVGVVTYDTEGTVLEWVYAGRSTQSAPDWRPLRSRFVVPRGVAAIIPRIIGSGPSTVWLGDVSLNREGNLLAATREDLADEISISNRLLDVTLSTADGTLSVKDKRTGQTWRQQSRPDRGFWDQDWPGRQKQDRDGCQSRGDPGNGEERQGF